MALQIRFPCYYIQSDWHEAKPSEKVWLNSKDLNDSSWKRNYELIIDNGPNVIKESNNQSDFTIKWNLRKCLAFEDGKSKVTHRFLPPLRVFTSIHQKSINCLDVAPTGMAVSASSDGTMKIWDTCGGIFKCNLEGHYFDVNKCKFFPSNLHVLSAGSDMLIKIWSAIDGNCLKTMEGHKWAVTDIAFIDINTFVSVGRDGLVKLWNCEVDAVSEILYDLSAEYQKPTINACALNNSKEIDCPDKLSLLATESGFVHGLDINSRQSHFKIDCKSPVNCVAFCQGPNFVAGTDSGNVYEFDIRKPDQPTIDWHLSTSPILSLIALRRPFKGFVSGKQDGSLDFLYDDHKEIVHLTGSDCDPIYQIVFDDKFIYSACRDGKVRKYYLNNAFE